MRTLEYIAALEEYFKLTMIESLEEEERESTYSRMSELQNTIVKYKESDTTVTRVLTYKGNRQLIERNLEERAVKGIKQLPYYTIEEQFVEY